MSSIAPESPDDTLFPGYEPVEVQESAPLSADRRRTQRRYVTDGPRISGSVATDVRAWWPACPEYTPGDRLSDDAARHIPEANA